jgi:predicted ferric reductase
MRLADIEKKLMYPYYYFFMALWQVLWIWCGMYSTPGYYTTDKNYFVETTVYTVNPDKLVWTGTTKTVNPSKIEKMVSDIADLVSEKMKKDGFLK